MSEESFGSRENSGMDGTMVHGCPKCGYKYIEGMYSAVAPHAWFWSCGCSECPGDLAYCPNCGISLPPGPKMPCGSEADDEYSYRFREMERVLDRTSEKYNTLVDAVAPIVRFIEAWDGQPMGGIADEFYGIHPGSRWEAYLRLSEFRAIRDLISDPEGGTHVGVETVQQEKTEA